MTTTEGLAGKVKRGLLLSFLNTVLGRAGSLVVGIALARVLAPEDFGVFAVALVALNAVLAVNELGVSLALVRWPGDPREIAPTVTTISMASSGLLYLLCAAAAGPFAAALHAPQAAGVVRLLCLAVLIDGVTNGPAQFINRDFAQGRRMAVDLTNLVLSSGLTLVCALAGLGPWSLAVGRLVGNGLTAAMLCRLSGYWPRPGWDRAQARPLLRFGLPLAAASLLAIGVLDADNVVVGRLLGPVSLGFYVQAFTLSSWPVNIFSTITRRVTLAAFARLQDEPAARSDALLRAVALLSAGAFGAAAMIGLLAEPIITTLYGARWAPAAGALAWLAVVGAARVLIELAYDFLVAAGITGRTTLLQGLWLVLLVPAVALGAHEGGVRGAGLAHAVVTTGVVLPCMAYVVVRATGVSAGALLEALARPLLGVAALAVAVVLVRALMDPGWPELVVAGLAGLAAYTPVVAPLRRLART